MQQPIAILDSGVGGLTVAKEIMRQLPKESIIYFGDTARAPYGPRPAEEVARFTHQVIDYLCELSPKMVVIACNTATAVALDEARSRLAVPVVGVIHPGARAAIKMTRNQVVGVIGTEGTIRSDAYTTALRQICPGIQVISLACPDLVPLVEKGIFDPNEVAPIVERSLMPLRQHPIDCLILGCTHYPYLSDSISEFMGPHVNLISSAEETAREISTLLYHRGLLAGDMNQAEHRYFCSGDPRMFRDIAESWLQQKVDVTPVRWEVLNNIS
ncbi:glutamate racemase [Paenibacillus silviterrae]|uniref:glutamate racemase n=1 Tax=Paenibacillus silviterrae TaxID=3242194 RepID=UPI00254355DA|nr:glutamate racemase [Paenibacillus chinjuensis]